MNTALLTSLGERFEPTLASLIRVHSINPDLFLALSMDEVEESAAPWIKGLSDLARTLREMVLRGFEIYRRNDAEDELRGAGHTLSFERALEPNVTAFMRSLNGVHLGKPGRDYRGSAASERELLFLLGDPSSWAGDEARLQARLQNSPLVLRIAEEDRGALLSGTPAYAIYSLQRLAMRVVAAPSAIYRGLRRGGRLAKGLAFCGHPRQALGNHGEVIQADLDTMVFVVYSDAEGFVFDWDWVQSESGDASSPYHTQDRFAERLETLPEAVLTGVNELKPGKFQPGAWLSTRGDCIFHYLSDAPSFAERVNDDLTVFWGFAAPTQMTGCKVKNVSRLLTNKEATKVQKKQGHLPLSYFLGRSLSIQALNGHTRHYGELVHQAEESGTEVRIELPPQQEHTTTSG